MAVQLDRPEPGVAVLRLDRPERRNALDTATIEALLGHLAALEEDPDHRALVLSTTDTTALCAGADVREQLDHEGGVRRMEAFAKLYAAWAALSTPTIAVCVGDTLGAGAELAAGADLRVGGDNLRIGWLGAKLGVPVGAARLIPLVGYATATELLLTARMLDAPQATALGLLNRTVPAGTAEAEAVAVATDIARLPAEGVKQMKRLLQRFEQLHERIDKENAVLVYWQRHGAGLPTSG
jgi:enoyl-CoA hydratase